MPRILLTPPQAEFLDAPEPFVGFVGGIGSGKSFVLCYHRVARCRRAGVYMVAAPTYPMLRDATLRSFFEVCERLRIPVTFNRSEMIARFPRSGAEVLFRSADDPDRLRGPNLDEADLDEASVMHEDAYRVMIGRLRRGGKMGRLRAAFTPKGKTHWTYGVFGKGTPDTRLVRSRTADNPFLAAEFEATVARQYGEGSRLAEQELGGEFVDWSGGVFQAHWFRLVAESQRLAARVRYWDKAASEGDGCYTAGVLVARAVTGRFTVEDVVRGRWSALERDRAILQTAHLDRQRYGAVTVVVEQEPGSGGKESAEATVRQLAGFGVKLDKVTDPKGERYQPLASQAEAGNVDVLDRPWAAAFVEELAAVPEGRYKDQADAAAGAFAHVARMHAGGGGFGLPDPGQGTMYAIDPAAFG